MGSEIFMPSLSEDEDKLLVKGVIEKSKNQINQQKTDMAY
jgi:hypothetical protein